MKFLDTSKVTLLDELAKTEYFEYDLIVKVIHIFKKDEQKSEVSFIDVSQQIWYAEVYTNKFRWLREGQIVKVKGASKFKQAEGNLFMKFSTNILTIPADMKIAEDLFELDSSKSLHKEAKALLKNEEGTHKILATDINDLQIKGLPLSKLETIAKDETPNKLFRARFSVEALASQTASETI